MHYWDTSTLVKLHVSEADSSSFVSHLAGMGPATISELARWEVFRVFARKEADGGIAVGAAEQVFARFEADVAAGRVTLLPLDAATEEHFRKLTLRLHRLSPTVCTRTLDAIHLATAELHHAVELVATDRNMRKCATAIGLKVYP
jgi:predicted nucleic acid-binding protein